MKRCTAIILLILLVSSTMIAPSAISDQQTQGLIPPLAPGDPINNNHFEHDLIEIKFREGLTIRLRNGQPTDLNSQSMQSAQTVTALQAVSGGMWTRSHAVSEGDLDTFQLRAERNAGRDLPDLNLWFRLKLPTGMEAGEGIALFSQLAEVETAIPVPKPVANPVPPDYQDGETTTDIYQRYLDAAPDGIDARYAWEGNGGTGDTVKICDVERGINRNHEDLPSITMAHASPASTVTEDDHNHGTAVIGEMVGKPNGWGVTGIAYDADMWFGATLS